ncbi:cytochrome b-c1 complex subunit 8 [Infundibulicybe gibba]|nr:cytochrome b-c1 complex subunit 8 [Infundibulicybe gibba]
MRPSIARLSDMPGPKVYNLWWGDKTGIKQKGMVTYTISPWQSKAAPNMLRNYLFNGYRRLSGEALFFLIPFGAGYGIYSWAKSYDAYQNSKAGHIAAGAHH